MSFPWKSLFLAGATLLTSQVIATAQSSLLAPNPYSGANKSGAITTAMGPVTQRSAGSGSGIIYVPTSYYQTRDGRVISYNYKPISVRFKPQGVSGPTCVTPVYRLSTPGVPTNPVANARITQRIPVSQNSSRIPQSSSRDLY